MATRNLKLKSRAKAKIKAKKHSRASAKAHKKAAVKQQNVAKQELSQAAFDQALIRWYAPEFLRFQKGKLWLAIALLINLALLAYAVWSGSWTMGVVFIVLPLVYALEHRKKPKVVDVVISQYGIKFGIFKLPYSEIRRFWVLHDPPYVDELHLLTSNKLHPEITIPLMGADPTLLRQYLITQIPEWEGKKQSTLDILIKFLRLA